MLLRVDDEAQVEKYQKECEVRLHKILPKKIIHKFGHFGLSYEEEVFSDGDLWYFSQRAGEPSPNRYWNAFGLLSALQPANIVVEINFPIIGVNRRISGVFARDNKSHEIMVLHRGGIGGGRKGIGKQAFLRFYRGHSPGRLVEFDDHPHNPGKAILVAGLDGASFKQDLNSFVRNVYFFKEEIA